MRTLLAVAMLLNAAGAFAGPIPLPEGEEFAPLWEPVVFLTPGSEVKPEDACGFHLTADPKVGKALVVGPWLAGLWAARAEYRKPLPPEKTDFTGLYRTVDLLPMTAIVRVEYYGADGKRLGLVAYSLAPSSEWREFRVHLDKFPPKTASLRVMYGLASHTPGQVWFARLEARPGGPHPLADLEAPRITRPAPPPRAKGTGFYRVEQSADAWWLIDPEGRPTWSRATDPPSNGGVPKATGYIAQLRAWGFNGLAGWHSSRVYTEANRAEIAAGRPAMPRFSVLNYHDCHRFGEHDMLTDRRGRRKEGEHGFPDPFDPRWVEAARKLAQERAALVRDAPWFVAWFVDNEISYDDLYRYFWSTHCAKAFVAFLRERTPDIAALNRRWGTSFTDYAALAEAKPEPPLPRGPMYDDFLAFERVLAKRYVDVTLEVTRAADPNHLIASNRHNMGGLATWLRHIDLCAAYDIVACNLYPQNQEPGVGAEGLAVLREVARRSGRPVIIGEYSVPAMDSGLYEQRKAPLDWSFPQAVPTQAIRARQAARVTADYFNEPTIVGAHWFIYYDIDTEKREANRGLTRSDGRPWDALTAALTEVHAGIDRHLGIR